MSDNGVVHCKKRKRRSIFRFSQERPPVTLLNLHKDDFMEWETDEQVYRLQFKSRKEAKIHIKKVVKRHPWYKAICVEVRAIGCITLTRGHGDSSCRAEIGSGLARNCWGKGFASEAVRLCLSTAFTDMPDLQRIEGFVEPENVASQRVLEKAGFVKEGLLCKYFTAKGKTRDYFSYSFLAEDLPHPV